MIQTFEAAGDDRDWTYLNAERPADRAGYDRWFAQVVGRPDPMFLAIVLPNGCAAGLAAYLRIEPSHGAVEVGHIHYGRPLQRSRAGTEAMFLMMEHAFALGYRRYEWKCDSLNARSRAAALRYGFQYEGTFRNAVITKGRNRDTSWYSIIDDEWPGVRAALMAWLDDANFDRQGTSLRSLASFRGRP